MVRHALDWELQQLEPGTEVLVSDANKRPIARGVLRDDRKSLSGPNGEYFSLDNWSDGWTLTVLKHRRSNPGGGARRFES
jgi:hypothetical protein